MKETAERMIRDLKQQILDCDKDLETLQLRMELKNLEKYQAENGIKLWQQYLDTTSQT